MEICVNLVYLYTILLLISFFIAFKFVWSSFETKIIFTPRLKLTFYHKNKSNHFVRHISLFFDWNLLDIDAVLTIYDALKNNKLCSDGVKWSITKFVFIPFNWESNHGKTQNEVKLQYKIIALSGLT